MLPVPRPALVIRYSYLWYREHAEGREEGIKDRPSAIIAAVTTGAEGEWRVLVLPITHTPPQDASDALEIPPETKHRLGLDGERSWIVLTEWNEFTWPGPDLRLASNGDENSVAYGFLPARFFEKLKKAFLEKARNRAASKVARTH
jgi:hypothetical protein